MRTSAEDGQQGPAGRTHKHRPDTKLEEHGRPAIVDGPKAQARREALRADLSSDDESVLLAPRLTFKAGGKLGLDGDDAKQPTFQSSKKMPVRRSKAAGLQPFRPDPIASDPAKAEPLYPNTNIAQEHRHPSEFGWDGSIEVAAGNPTAGRDDEQDELALAPAAASDVTAKASKGLRRYDQRKTAKQEPLQRLDVDRKPTEPTTPSDHQPSVERDAPAGEAIGPAPSFPALSRHSLASLQETLASSLNAIALYGSRLVIHGRLRALQAGQTSLLALKRSSQALQTGGERAWPHITAKAQEAQSLCAGLTRLVTNQSQAWTKEALCRLTLLLQGIGPFLQRAQQVALSAIEGDAADQGGATAKTTPSVSNKAKAAFGSSLQEFKAKLTEWGETAGSVLASTGQRFAATGLAAVLVAHVIVMFGYAQLSPSADASLTFQLPERPTSDALDGSDEIVDESAEAIETILSYVAAQSSASGREAQAVSNPILTKVASMEGFEEFVRAAKTVDIAQLLKPGEPYTIFLPNDEAFAKLGQDEIDGLLNPTGHERLLTLLSHHIVPKRITLESLKRGAVAPTSLAGFQLPLDGSQASRIGGASLVDTDLEADNSILHVIDEVLAVPELWQP
jgi:uncharacterized surface protein with fasciclin (FAS1) repeats